MPKKPVVTKNSNGGLHLSYGGIGAIVGSIAALAIVWGGLNNIATKSEVNTVQSHVDSIDARQRTIEIGFARYFGKSPTEAQPSNDEQPEIAPDILYAEIQYRTAGAPEASAAQIKNPQRRVVVPQWYIEQFHLEPWHGGSYAVLGEDGQLYALDDVMAVFINAHENELRSLPKQQFNEQMRRKK